MHRTEGAGAQAQRQITRIAPVGLDAIPRLSGNQGWRGDGAVQTFTAQVAVQPEAAGTGFVHEFQAAAAGELFKQPVDGVLLGAHGTQINDWCIV